MKKVNRKRIHTLSYYHEVQTQAILTGIIKVGEYDISSSILFFSELLWPFTDMQI